MSSDCEGGLSETERGAKGTEVVWSDECRLRRHGPIARVHTHLPDLSVILGRPDHDDAIARRHHVSLTVDLRVAEEGPSGDRRIVPGGDIVEVGATDGRVTALPLQ
jgi:hypothetical protein